MIRVNKETDRGWPVENIHKSFKFPVGEIQVTVDANRGDLCHIDFEFENNEEIMELLLVADAIKRSGGVLKTITIPYFPYARQDRVANEGEALSVKVFADLVNSLGAQHVVAYDPHSDVTGALINNFSPVTQDEIFEHFFDQYEIGPCKLVACDAGAQKKIYKLAQLIKAEVIPCDKKRNTETGEISGVVVHAGDLTDVTCVMVDDICDGGRSFIEVAKLLREKNASKIILMVTHGFFTKGFEVFNGLVDEIFTRKGRVYRGQSNR